MSAARRLVIVKISVPGFHYWKAAPDEVGYLREPHRHLFVIRAGWDVTHDDREIEFHTAQSWLCKALQSEWICATPEPINFGPMSCEHIAIRLYDKIALIGLPTPCMVEVWEDGECGAHIEFKP